MYSELTLLQRVERRERQRLFEAEMTERYINDEQQKKLCGLVFGDDRHYYNLGNGCQGE